jgi:polyisoprenoid-binding protein YceI
MKIARLGLAALLTAGALYAGNYNVDTAHSSVGFKVKHMMISNVKGSFDKFSGTFEYDEKTNKVVSLAGSIETSSINTANAKRDAHLQSADFFDAPKYPSINFVLSKIEDDKVYGKLTMRGIAKDVILDFENNGIGKDLWGNTRVGLTLSGKLNRKDFGLVYNSALETGGVLIGDVVKLDIEIQGILAK